jgi:hypothetical protein
VGISVHAIDGKNQLPEIDGRQSGIRPRLNPAIISAMRRRHDHALLLAP